MEQKDLRFIPVQKFIHLEGASYQILSNFKQLVESGFVNLDNIIFLTVKYDTQKGIESDAPVKIFLKDNTAIYLNLTAGYSGSGPTDLCSVIKMCFKDMDKAKISKDILTNRKLVDLTYVKDTENYYQFSCQGEYYYSM